MKTAAPAFKPAVLALPRWDWWWLGLLLVAALLVRVWHLDLVEFKSDEAVAAQIALGLVQDGQIPATGLMSSVGVTNPPLFIYLLVPLVWVSADPGVLAVLFALLNVVAVGLCWWVTRRYVGRGAAWVAAAMFALSPWAVIYSRKIWAIDFEPLLMVGLYWALLALVVGRSPRAVFWVVCLPLWIVQNHYGGIGFVVFVVLALLWLRPRLDWRWAAGGVAAGLVFALPYLVHQVRHDYPDVRRATQVLSGGGPKWSIPPGITIHPDSGVRLPRKEHWVHWLAIMNAGGIEDILGLSTSPEIDRHQVYARKTSVPQQYFAPQVRGLDVVLLLQRLAALVGVCWWGWLAVRAVRRLPRFPWIACGDDPGSLTAWVLIGWTVVPLLVFQGLGTGSYLLYFVKFYPVHFVVSGWLAQQLWDRLKTPAGRCVLALSLGVVLVCNAWYLARLYSFLASHGGAQGTYGTVLSHKRDAARYLAAGASAGLWKQVEAQLQLSVASALGQPPPPADLFRDVRLLQMDRWGQVELPQVDLPYLMAVEKQRVTPTTPFPTNAILLMTDRHRTNFDPPPLAQLEQFTRMRGLAETNFGPIRIYLLERGPTP